MIQVFVIRPLMLVTEDQLQPPRTLDSVRKSLDGSLCVLVFDIGTEPEGIGEVLSQAQVLAVLNSPESEGIWWTEEG